MPIALNLPGDFGLSRKKALLCGMIICHGNRLPLAGVAILIEQSVFELVPHPVRVVHEHADAESA